MRIADHLRYPGQRHYLFRRTLRVTTSHNNSALGIFALNAPDRCACVTVGGGRHRAGIQDDNLSLRRYRSPIQASLFKLALDGRSISLSSTAAKILDVETRHLSIVP
jgi:hypothetical protein